MLTAAIHPAIPALRRIRFLTRLMDTAVTIPGTNIRLGLDPVVGLVPVLGDLLPLLVSAYIIIEARRLGVSRDVVGRMMFNVGIDALVGFIPGLGDVFDVAWKANVRNLRLVEESLGLDRCADVWA